MEVGLTEIDPPLAFTVRLLPFVPVIAIPVALLAVTVKVEELPLEIDWGLALMVTVGVAAAAWLLIPTTANAGTAQERSIERI